MQLFGITGYSGSGKTTLIEKLLPLFLADGLSVSTLKHTHHQFEWDQPGKDSWRHRQAGAQQVLLAGGQQWVLSQQHTPEQAPSLEQLLQQFAPCDWLLIEGFKQAFHPRLEVHRPALGKPYLYPEDTGICALASDADGLEPGRLPLLPLNQPQAIYRFILQHGLRWPLEQP